MKTFDIVPGTIRLMGFSYNQNSQTLDATSNCGTVYQYFNVPEKIIDELKDADDPGNYYKTSIRGKFKRLFKAYDYSVLFKGSIGLKYRQSFKSLIANEIKPKFRNDEIYYLSMC